jgi:hypothetical protein
VEGSIVALKGLDVHIHDVIGQLQQQQEQQPWGSQLGCRPCQQVQQVNMGSCMPTTGRVAASEEPLLLLL